MVYVITFTSPSPLRVLLHGQGATRFPVKRFAPSIRWQPLPTYKELAHDHSEKAGTLCPFMPCRILVHHSQMHRVETEHLEVWEDLPVAINCLHSQFTLHVFHI
jgi:hypothetical protein